ncbi:hypothetical protein GKE82_25975 [Conexibacter sp. W3-3-2]|uniref:hypothetical protein n=1 Tax=Conexibacter sp. W3-3-2 TaxID=2675227 RepID=UPI0012B9D540|nr:hypothetical protein [Conexibacter sp. W3-3-2]MTD47653.1 hypothetical protein [Conexibacter sp. W3-3-2]
MTPASPDNQSIYARDALREGLALLVATFAHLATLDELEARLFAQTDARLLQTAGPNARWLSALAQEADARRALIRDRLAQTRLAITPIGPALEEFLAALPAPGPRAPAPQRRIAQPPSIDALGTDADDILAAITKLGAWHRRAAEDLLRDLRRAITLLTGAPWPASAPAALAASAVASLRAQLESHPAPSPNGTKTLGALAPHTAPPIHTTAPPQPKQGACGR